MGRPVNKKYFGNSNGFGIGGYTITAITVSTSTRGNYIVEPTVLAPTTLPNGVSVETQVHSRVLNATVGGAGSGYNFNDTLSVEGGTKTVTATFTLTQTLLTEVVISDGGTGWTVGDSVTITNAGAGGANSAFEVTEIDGGNAPVTLAGVTIASTTGNFTVGGTHEFIVGQKIIATGGFTGGGGGQGGITGYTSGTTTYYVIGIPTTGALQLSSSAGGSALDTTAGGTSGVTFTWTPGEITDVNITTPGTRVTANPVPLSPSPGSGNVKAGATFNFGWGVKTMTSNVLGNYTVIPTNPAYLTSLTGSGSTATIHWEVLSVTVTNSADNRGYAENTSTNVTFSAGGATAAVNTVTYTETTAGEPVILARAWISGARKDVDIVKQRSSRRYLVDADDSNDEVIAELKAGTSSADGEMDLTAFDSSGYEYWVTKLTSRKALLIRKNLSNGEFANESVAPWVIGIPPTLNENVRIESN